MRSIRILAAVAVLAATTAATGAAQLPKLLPECFGQVATIVGTDGDDFLEGTPGEDVVAALEGDDVIRGLDGDDALCGGPGDDDVRGGEGVDGLAVGRGADSGRGGPGFDLVVEFSSDQCGPCLPVDTSSRDHSADLLSGGPGPDWIVGEGGDDMLRGGPEDDVVLHLGRFTSATIDLSLGVAVSSAGDTDTLAGVEHAMGSVSSDTIRGDERGNILFGGGLSGDFVSGEGGGDLLFTDFSGSTLVGGSDEAADEVRVAMQEPATIDLAAGYSMSQETSHLHSPDVILGFERVVASEYDDVVYGDDGANVIVGAEGDDELIGRGGNDYVFGDYGHDPRTAWTVGALPGDDFLDGGDGGDRLHGGPMVDECVNGEKLIACEEPDAPSAAPRAPELPWWWARYEIEYLHENLALEVLLTR